jgi:RNA polymerase sigma-70 factor (ECF subfamily)
VTGPASARHDCKPAAANDRAASSVDARLTGQPSTPDEDKRLKHMVMAASPRDDHCDDPTPVLALIEAEIPRLRRYARYLTRDADRADDLVQEALTRAVAKVHTWQPGTNLRAWLFVILRNVFISELRHGAREPQSDLVADNHPSLAVKGTQDERMALVDLQRAFDQLSAEHREILLLVAIEGLPYEEAAAILEVPVGTVRSRLSRARTALRGELEEPSTDRDKAV